LKPHLHELGIRSNLGIKYQKITGDVDLAAKAPYDPEAARDQAAEHAGHFMFNRERQIEWLAGAMGGRPPLVIAPYDAELFGHWWFEGPMWIEYLLRKVCYDQNTVKTITVPEYLAQNPTNQVCEPSLSSWGARGYCEVWLEDSNDWVYRHLHECADRMVDLASAYPNSTGLRLRALNQAARELLLAQSSDWAFIMKTGTMVEYAIKRTVTHVDHFLKLDAQIRSGDIDEPWLTGIESRHNVFPTIDYRLYGATASDPPV
jgi:1,4-alpha-glucan branching enzyme